MQKKIEYPALVDHPHIHGEYRLSKLKSKHRLGSPPHTWGILDHHNPDNQEVRITPTYMGNTNLKDLDEVEGKDHPHIHGEYSGL